jgi:hypothetical protein
MANQQTAAALNDLIKFIDPVTRKDILESSLNLLFSLSNDEKFLEMIPLEKQEDLFKRCGMVYSSITATGSPTKVKILSILVNLTANKQCNECLLKHLKPILDDCFDKCIQQTCSNEFEEGNPI